MLEIIDKRWAWRPRVAVDDGSADFIRRLERERRTPAGCGSSSPRNRLPARIRRVITRAGGAAFDRRRRGGFAVDVTSASLYERSS